ncbi:MAG: hypothetical protein LBD93_09390 [Treponema sp.]|jgi:hypothetical protein|nr:hypothetical protein [Treponema sp.]
MVNFEAELDTLLSHETGRFPQYELAELAAEGQAILEALKKEQYEFIDKTTDMVFYTEYL